MDTGISAGHSVGPALILNLKPLVIFADFVRLGLEVVHNMLACGLSSNPHMMYALLLRAIV
jgi:hypothetical protein